MISGSFEGIGQMQIDHAWFDNGISVSEVQFQDLFHAGQDDHDPAPNRQTTARKTGSRTAGQKGHVKFIADLDGR